MKQNMIRNLAIISHVDHGKTTLVDQMLRQSGAFHKKQAAVERIMDRNELERERGITIMAKNTAVFYGDYKFNIVDTPGHADFGGEVERIVQMVDGVLLLVDAFEGPMPQTRFVLRKALEAGLAPIVVINKVDRANARPAEVVDEVIDLFIELDAGNEQLEFPVIFTDAVAGVSSVDHRERGTDLKPLFDMIVKNIPIPQGDPQATLQVGVNLIDYDRYLGRQAIGRVVNGTIEKKQEVAVVRAGGEIYRQRPAGLFVFENLKKVPADKVQAGEIVVISGLKDIYPGNTVTDPVNPAPLDFVNIDEPAVMVGFHVNKSPFAGEEGEYVASRKIWERLMHEQESDVSLRVEVSESNDMLVVYGRGTLHLSILMENMRREGFEFEVSRPQVLTREIDGVTCEPVEELIVEVPDEYTGIVMEKLGARKGVMNNMEYKDDGQIVMSFHVPTRGLFGFRSEFITDTKGTGIMNHSLDHYMSCGEEIQVRTKGVLVASHDGEATAYGLAGAEDRGHLFVSPGTPVYRGMIVGECSGAQDIFINVCKKKKLTNVRAAGSDEAIELSPPREMNLEQSLEFIAGGELVEVTPKSIRMRKQRVK